MSQHMIRLKYQGSKEGGLPVTYPIGCRQHSGLRKVVWANPYLDVTKEEADFLLKDKHNWAKASEKELKEQFQNDEKEISKPKAVRASIAKEAAAEKKRGRGRPKEHGAVKPKARA